MLELEVAENAAELCKSTVTETVIETVICRARFTIFTGCFT